jgi:hypothetical protein
MSNRWWVPFGIITVLLLPIVLPLYANTILGSADNLAHLFRVVNLDLALSQGYLWPRWAGLEAHGYGAPIFNFNYMLPYYLVRTLWHLTGSLLHASQFFMILTLLGSAFGMYVFVASLFTVPAAIVAAVVYAYMPYHLMTIYLYGGYGEALAYVWVPLLAYFFVKNIKHPTNRIYSMASIVTLALLILTHNLSALMAIPFVYSLIFFVSSQFSYFHRIRNAVLSTSASILLTAWFWLPSMWEQHLTKLSVLFEKETALRGYFFQIIAPIVENSILALRFIPPSYYSYAIGIPTIFVVCISCLFLFRSITLGNIWKHEHTRIGILYVCWFVITLCMTRAWSEPVWKLLPAQMNFLAYPYRFFFLNSFAVAVLAGFVITRLSVILPINIHKTLRIALVAFVIWQGVIYAHPDIDRFSFGEQYFTYEQTVREAPFTHKNMGYIEFIPKTADSAFINALDDVPIQSPRAEIISGSGLVTIRTQKVQDLSLHVQANDTIKLRINILYFPGWVGVIRGVTYTPNTDREGRMVFTIPQGEYDISIQFRDTPVRTLATYISIISLCVLLGFIVFVVSKDRFHSIRAKSLR